MKTSGTVAVAIATRSPTPSATAPTSHGQISPPIDAAAVISAVTAPASPPLPCCATASTVGNTPEIATAPSTYAAVAKTAFGANIPAPHVTRPAPIIQGNE